MRCKCFLVANELRMTFDCDEQRRLAQKLLSAGEGEFYFRIVGYV